MSNQEKICQLLSEIENRKSDLLDIAAAFEDLGRDDVGEIIRNAGCDLDEAANTATF